MSARDKFFYFIYLHRTGLTVILLSTVLLLYPLYENNPYTLGVTNLIAINTIVVLGLNLFIGYAGQISLGHAAFFGLGAYGSAIATATWGLPPWPSMVCGRVAGRPCRPVDRSTHPALVRPLSGHGNPWFQLRGS